MNESLLKEVFQPMIGSPAWNVRRGHGSFVTLEFGSPSLMVRQPIKTSEGASTETKRALGRRRISVVGEYHFWIYCCNWQLSFQRQLISTNEASKDSIDEACRELDGRILQRVDPSDSSNGIVCRFEDDLLLKTSPDICLKADQWLLYHKDKIYTLTYEGILKSECKFDH